MLPTGAVLPLVACSLLASATSDVCHAPGCSQSESFDLLRSDYPQELQDWFAFDQQHPDHVDPWGAATPASQEMMRMGELSEMQGEGSSDLEESNGAGPGLFGQPKEEWTLTHGCDTKKLEVEYCDNGVDCVGFRSQQGMVFWADCADMCTRYDHCAMFAFQHKEGDWRCHLCEASATLTANKDWGVYERKQAPTPAPSVAPTAAPTKAPTNAPTESPTRAPTNAPTKSPTTAPTPLPTSLPTEAPTAAPSAAPLPVAPTSTEASAMDDPHLTNLGGERFDIKKPGRLSLLQMPFGGSEQPLLRLDADVKASNDTPCALYIKMVALSGRWLSDQVVRIRPSGRTTGGKVAGESAQWPLSMQVASSEASVDGQRWAPFGGPEANESLAKASTHMVKMLAVRLEEFGPFSEGQAFRFELGGVQPPASLTVSQGSHQALNVALAGMAHLGRSRFGGLLGTEPHDRGLETPTELCMEHRAHGKGEPLLLGVVDAASGDSATSPGPRSEREGSWMRAAWD